MGIVSENGLRLMKCKFYSLITYLKETHRAPDARIGDVCVVSDRVARMEMRTQSSLCWHYP